MHLAGWEWKMGLEDNSKLDAVQKKLASTPEEGWGCG